MERAAEAFGGGGARVVGGVALLEREGEGERAEQRDRGVDLQQHDRVATRGEVGERARRDGPPTSRRRRRARARTTPPRRVRTGARPRGAPPRRRTRADPRPEWSRRRRRRPRGRAAAASMSRPRRYDAGARVSEREHRGGDEHHAGADGDGRRPRDAPQIAGARFALDRNRERLHRRAEHTSDRRRGDQRAQLAHPRETEWSVRVPAQQDRGRAGARPRPRRHARRSSSTGASCHAAAPAVASAPATSGAAHARGGDSSSDDEHDARGAGHRGGEDAAGVEPPSPQLDREHHDGNRERGERGPHHPGARPPVVACGMTSTNASSGPGWLGATLPTRRVVVGSTGTDTVKRSGDRTRGQDGPGRHRG